MSHPWREPDCLSVNIPLTSSPTMPVPLATAMMWGWMSFCNHFSYPLSNQSPAKCQIHDASLIVFLKQFFLPPLQPIPYHTSHTWREPDCLSVTNSLTSSFANPVPHAISMTWACLSFCHHFSFLLSNQSRTTCHIHDASLIVFLQPFLLPPLQPIPKQLMV